MTTFADTFETPYDQYANRAGQKFKVVRTFTEDDAEHDISDTGPMYLIEFEDGTQIEAWSEEVTTDRWIGFPKGAKGAKSA